MNFNSLKRSPAFFVTHFLPCHLSLFVATVFAVTNSVVYFSEWIIFIVVYILPEEVDQHQQN